MGIWCENNFKWKRSENKKKVMRCVQMKTTVHTHKYKHYSCSVKLLTRVALYRDQSSMFMCVYDQTTKC